MIQSRISNGTDHIQSFNLSFKVSDLKNNKKNGENRQKLCIPIIENSQIFSITKTLSGSLESGEATDPISFLGRGGFGEVRA